MKKRLLIIATICFSYSFFGIAQTYDWSIQYANNSANKEGKSVATDSQNNCIVGGVYQQTIDVDPGSGQTLLSAPTGKSGFVTKTDVNGNLLWAMSVGDTTKDATVFDVACDANDNVYVVGSFEGSMDADPGTGVVTLTSAGGKDIFIIKLDANGNHLWSKSYGSWIGVEEAFAASITPNNSVVVVGTYRTSVNFDPGNTDTTLTSFLGEGFILELSSTGNFSWVRSIDAQLQDVVVDQANNSHILANFSNTVYCDSDTLYPTVPQVTSSANDVAVIKLDNTGNYIWAKNIAAGYFSDFGLGLALEDNGNVYTTGTFAGKVDFNPSTNPADTNFLDTDFNDNGADMFVSKITNTGSYAWAHKFSSENLDEGYGIEIENNTNVVVAGSIGGTVDLDPSANDYWVGNLIGSFEPILFSLDLNGNFVKASEFTSDGHSSAFDVALSNDGSIYLTGRFNNDLDCDPDSNATAILSAAGNSDIFIVKLKDESFGIETNQLLPVTNVYPNPGANQIFIALDKTPSGPVTTKIFNQLGAEVYSKEHTSSEIIRCDVDLPAGMYIVTVTSQGRSAYFTWVRK